jgi:hypothetical protein
VVASDGAASGNFSTDSGNAKGSYCGRRLCANARADYHQVVQSEPQHAKPGEHLEVLRRIASQMTVSRDVGEVLLAITHAVGDVRPGRARANLASRECGELRDVPARRCGDRVTGPGASSRRERGCRRTTPPSTAWSPTCTAI